MNKLIVTLTIIALVAAAGATVLAPKPAAEELLPETKVPIVEATAEKGIEVPTKTDETKTQAMAPSANNPLAVKTEEKTAPTTQPTTTPASTSTGTTTAGYDPYHTDVYPNNVYSEECTYDENGKLISKSVTTPATFGPETIWIDGNAYADVPGFGLVEWSGPSTVTHVYDMYMNGNQIGIMGGDDEVTGEYATPKATPDSFENLHSIICWDVDTKIVKHGDEVSDVAQVKRTLRIVPPATPNDYTRYYLDDPRSERKIEVFVLKHYLEEQAHIYFKVRTEKDAE